jgi:5-methyltetrahydrofolate--homocysteine methyltransferase
MEDLLKPISRGVQDGEDKKVLELVREALQSGISAQDILGRGLIPGIQALGKLFKDGRAYLPEILISCRAMNRGLEILKPFLSSTDISGKGTVVLGTVEGDMHDIGKNLVKLMLESNGFQVEDLGTDVAPEAFVSAVQGGGKVDIVAMSALLTMTMTSIPDVIEALKRAGLRDKVKIMIGGAPVTREFADEIGAEGYAEDCVSAVDEAIRLTPV